MMKQSGQNARADFEDNRVPGRTNKQAWKKKIDDRAGIRQLQTVGPGKETGLAGLIKPFIPFGWRPQPGEASFNL